MSTELEKFADKPWNWESLSENHFNYFSTLYYYSERKTQTVENTQIYQEDLIAKAWHPERFQDWYLDNEDKSFHED